MSPDTAIEPRLVWMRVVIFALASSSFACLLGTFYGFWAMKTFACYAYLPAATALALLAWRKRGTLPARWIVHGALAGVVAALVYDLYRLPFVLNGVPLFKAFPRFGELLWGGTEPRWLVQALGWTYHFSNGAALGIMFLAGLHRPTPARLFLGAVSWALVVELLLLLTPYTSFFGIPFDRRFIALTLTAHLVFGVALALELRLRASLLCSGSS